MRNHISTAAAAAFTLSLALLTACNASGVSPGANVGGGTAPLGVVVPNAGCENGKSGVGTQTPRTEFTANGRYIQERVGVKAAQNFLFKGIAYSPTPIGNGVTDPPACNDPLRNDNKAIWSRDLPLMRAMGVNVIRVFNVVPPPWDENVGTIDEFLDAAWNKGQNPIYVLMTISFPGTALNNADAARDIGGQYKRLAAKYAQYPAVMGVSIGNEITGGPDPQKQAWWNNFNIVAQSAKDGFASKNAKKLVTTADYDAVTTFEVNGRKQIAQIYYGEKYGAKVDAWGDNLYRGRTVSDLLAQIQDTTTKPVILTEYGATAAYHPAWSNTYEYSKSAPHQPGRCLPPEGPNGPVNRDVAELPGAGHNPDMAGLEDLVRNVTDLMYAGYQKGGLVSGGFYFEWTDEWWKADAGNPAYRSEHVGNLPYVNYFPGCGDDAAWYGLNSVKRGGSLDELTARPTLETLKNTWAQEQP